MAGYLRTSRYGQGIIQVTKLNKNQQEPARFLHKKRESSTFAKQNNN